MEPFVINSGRSELWRYPLPGVTGGSGITVVDIIVVELNTPSGETGMGFSYVLGGGGHAVSLMTSNMLQEFVIGKTQIPPQALWHSLTSSLNRLGRGVGYLAISAIDVAAWDLWAKTQNKTLGEVLGGTSKPIPVYGSGGFGPKQPPEDAVKQAIWYVDKGYSAVKLRFAGDFEDIERLRAVREALPDTVKIMGDANEKCDLLTAKWLANACADYNLAWLEDPLKTEDIRGYEQLALHSPIPLATGEHHQGLVELTPFFKSKSCAVVQPDLAMTGGITETMRIATIAGYYGLAVAPHFLPALFVHVAVANPAVKWLEHFPLLEPLFCTTASVDENGMISPPDCSGHGLSWASGVRDEFRVDI